MGIAPIISISVIVAFGVGYKARSLVQDGRDLAVYEKQAEIKLKEAGIAQELEVSLQEIHDAVRENEPIRTKIVERTVYVNSCIDDDGMQLINSYASGSTGKPKKEVP